MRWSMGRFSSPRQYAPATLSSLKAGNGAGGLHVRAGAQVLEVAVAVRGDRLFLGNLLDDLQLERLVGVHFQAVLAEYSLYTNGRSRAMTAFIRFSISARSSSVKGSAMRKS